MKFNKSLLAAALGLSMAVSVQAFDEIYLTGSTAMRATIYSVLSAAGPVFSSAPVITGYGGKGNGDNYMAFYGTLNGNSSPSVINCYWSGSEAGIQAVASNSIPAFYQTFMADSLVQTSSSVDNSASTPPSTQTQPAMLAMDDNAQSFSRTTKPKLTGKEVGIITFKWVRNPGLWTGTNVTDSEIIQALNGGAVRSVFTGVAGQSDFVYVSGRDSSSGTRANAFGDSGFGILSTPQQIELSGGNMITIDAGGDYIGDAGFSSGGTLAGTLGSSTTASTDQVNGGTGFSVIAYLGVSDATTAITAGATECAYDGVTFSSAAVEEGNYTFWGNEYVYQAPSGVSASAAIVYNGIVNNTATYCDGVKAIALTAMHCTRSGPTSTPIHN
jgi:hypothetical protein